MNEGNSHRDAYKAALRFMDAQRRLLVEASADPNLLAGLASVVRYLQRLPENQVDYIFGIRQSARRKENLEEAIDDASHLSLDDVERKIETEDIARAELEAIAIGRFHVPRGSMRSMGNLERLRERLRTFVQNERTHVTITELARKTR